MNKMSDFQEEGLTKYRHVEKEISIIEDKISNLEQLNTTDSSLVAQYNLKVDELDRICKIYML